MSAFTLAELVVLAEMAIRGTALLAATLLLVAAASRSSPSVRHGVLLASLIALLLLPTAAWMLPAARLPLIPVPDADTLLIHAPPPRGSDAALAPRTAYVLPVVADTWSWVIHVYLAGAMVVGIWLLTGRTAMRRMCHAAVPVHDGRLAQALEGAARELGVQRSLSLRTSQWIDGPMTTGCLRPIVLLPEKALLWSDTAMRSVLLHEVGHVRRGDLLWRAVAEAACCLNWFNPLVWFVARRLAVQQELACDRAVLEHGIRPSAYAAILLQAATPRRFRLGTATAGLGRRADLQARIAALLDSGRTADSRKGRRTLVLCFVLCVALVLSTGVLDTAASGPIPAATAEVTSHPAGHHVRPLAGAEGLPEAADEPLLGVYLQRSPQRWWVVEDLPPAWRLRHTLTRLAR